MRTFRKYIYDLLFCKNNLFIIYSIFFPPYVEMVESQMSKFDT